MQQLQAGGVTEEVQDDLCTICYDPIVTPYESIWRCDVCKKPATCSDPECADGWRLSCAAQQQSTWCPRCRAGKNMPQEHAEDDDDPMARIAQMLNGDEIPEDPHAVARRRARQHREREQEEAELLDDAANLRQFLAGGAVGRAERGARRGELLQLAERNSSAMRQRQRQ